MEFFVTKLRMPQYFVVTVVQQTLLIHWWYFLYVCFQNSEFSTFHRQNVYEIFQVFTEIL